MGRGTDLTLVAITTIIGVTILSLSVIFFIQTTDALQIREANKEMLGDMPLFGSLLEGAYSLETHQAATTLKNYQIVSIIGIIGGVIIIALAIAGYGKVIKRSEEKSQVSSSTKSPHEKLQPLDDELKVLRLRLAKGEITLEEFEKLKRALEGSN